MFLRKNAASLHGSNWYLIDLLPKINSEYFLIGLIFYLGNAELTQFLIDHDADIKAVDNHGKTPLDYAIENGKQCFMFTKHNESFLLF